MIKLENNLIAVVIPCYGVIESILEVIRQIGPECRRIYVVDDGCPDGSGDFVAKNCHDERVCVLYNNSNEGVGGAVMCGYLKAVEDGAAVVVKLDGDGQMNPALIPQFIAPILVGEADYVKGNRFYNPEDVQSMPLVRVLGNVVLSFFTKLSSGYWDIFDPTNGYTAIHAAMILTLPLHKISKQYFFETDMLFRLNTLRARVIDVPMQAVYDDENSHLNVWCVAFKFLAGNVRNFSKRIFYNYFLRDFSVASLEIVIGLLMLLFGLVFGVTQWVLHARSGIFASTGTVMLSALSILAGIQLLISVINFDVRNVPDRAVHNQLWAILLTKGLAK